MAVQPPDSLTKVLREHAGQADMRLLQAFYEAAAPAKHGEPLRAPKADVATRLQKAEPKAVSDDVVRQRLSSADGPCARQPARATKRFPIFRKRARGSHPLFENRRTRSSPAGTSARRQRNARVRFDPCCPRRLRPACGRPLGGWIGPLEDLHDQAAGSIGF
jgi:hypothetical protein